MHAATVRIDVVVDVMKMSKMWKLSIGYLGEWVKG
jgi:hypothetical protein